MPVLPVELSLHRLVLVFHGGDGRQRCRIGGADSWPRAGGDITVVKRGLYAHHPHGVEVDETTIGDFFCGTAEHVKGKKSN